jgi:hypothetical protein
VAKRLKIPARQELEAYASDPLALARRLGIRLWWKQEDICLSVLQNKRTLVRAGFSTGKTFNAGLLVFWWFACFPSSICLTSAQTYPLLKEQLWAEVGAVYNRATAAGLQPPNSRLVTLRIGDAKETKHYALGISPAKQGGDDELGNQLAQGFHGKRLLVILDEAQAMDPARWSTFTSIGTGEDDRILVQGNPTVIGGDFERAAKPGSGWNAIAINCFEHPNVLSDLRGEPLPYPGGAVTLSWIEDRIWGPDPWCEAARGASPDNFEWPQGSGQWWSPGPLFQARVLGQFPSSGLPDTLIPLNWIEMARGRYLEPGDNQVQMGLDVSRFGSDQTPLYTRQGPCVLECQSWQGMDLAYTAGRAKETIERYPDSFIVVDDIGLGGGVTDMLQADGIDAVGMNVSSRPSDPEKWPNLRSEIMCSLADRFRTGDIDLTRLDREDYNRLASQLAAMRFSYDSRGRKVVASKDVLRKAIGRSPDDADALALAFASPEGAGVDVVGWKDMAGER